MHDSLNGERTYFTQHSKLKKNKTLKTVVYRKVHNSALKGGCAIVVSGSWLSKSNVSEIVAD